MIKIKSTSTPRLPKEYQEVEYIESAGSQYIDTKVAPNVNTRVVIDMQYLQEKTSSTDYYMMGIYGDVNDDNSPITFAWGTSKGFSSYWAIQIKNSGYSSSRLTYDSDFECNLERATLDISNDKVLINEITTNMKGSATRKTVDSSLGTLHLFAVHNLNNASITSDAPARIFACQIYDDTTLIRNFVPCYRKSDNEVGLYDLVNNEFYENASNHSDLPDEDGNVTSNSFIMGSIVGASDLNLKPYVGNKKVISRYVGDNLVYGKAISKDIPTEQKINYTMLYDNIYNDVDENQCKDATGGWSSGWVFYNQTPYGKFELSETGMSYGEDHSAYFDSKYAYTLNELNFDDIDFLFIKLNAYGYNSNTSYPMYDRYSYGPKDDNKWTPGGYMYVSGNTWVAPDGYQFAQYQITSIDTTYVKKANVKTITGNRHLILWATSSATGGQKLIDTCYNLAGLHQDDWQTLCTIAGLNAEDYENEVALCADANAITTILSNNSAVQYMIYNCTGSFMGEFVSNEDCLTALNNSEYKTLIQSNEHWNKFLNMVA